MYPDELAYELNLIPMPEKFSQRSKNKYVLYGIGFGLMLGISLATYMYFHKEQKKHVLSVTIYR
jgi:formate/nitrite transporter FocA (FNT family)